MSTQPYSVRHPKATLITWLFVIATMAFFMVVRPQLKIQPTLKSMIRANDPDLPFDHKVKQTLGDDEFIIVGIGAPKTVFTIPTLTYIDRLTSEIEKLPAVRKVYSLTRADDIRGRGGMMDVNDLIVDLPKTQDDLDRIEKEAFENPIYINAIVTPDKKVAGINVELKAGHTTKMDGETTQAIYDIIDKAASIKPPGVETHVSGFPVASYISGSYMITDMIVFTAGAMVMLTIIMWLVLRSWHGVAFTLFVTIGGVSITYGVMAAFHVGMNMPLSSVLAFMTAIGMEYSVYVAFAYQHAVQTGKPGRERRAALAEAILEVRFTVMMSAACAAAAFGSMLTNPIGDLKLMGTFLAIGTLACCVAALTIIPAWIALFPIPVPSVEKSPNRWLQTLIDAIGRLDSRRPLAVVAGLLVLMGLGIVAITHLKSDTDVLEYFRNSSTLHKDDQFIRHHMGDTVMPAVILAKDIDFFKEPANLQKLADVEAYAETLPHVTKAISHADHIKLMNEALVGEGSASYKLPATKAAVEQYLLLHNEPDDFHMWIDPDYKMASVMLRLDTMSSGELAATADKVQAFAKKKFPNADVRVVGTTLLVHRSLNTMSVSTVIGLMTATIAIWLIMVLGFRSIRIGTLALLPTLPPALMVFATLSLTGHALDPPTAITGSIALGIAIDDTTWFLSTWIAKRRKPGIDGPTAVAETITAIGRPMVLSSMVLGSGFLIMLASRYLVLAWLGVMMGIVAFWSIFWDVLCTPTLVRLFDPKLPKGRFGHEK